MSEQAPGLRRSRQMVRRHRILVGILATLGLFAGAAYAVLKPPMPTSAALVVLPQAAQTVNTETNGGPGTDSYVATQVVIASSDPVLAGALHKLGQAISLPTLRSEIHVTSVTSSILSITVTATTAAQAEATANAVARSYVAYVSSTSNQVGNVQANLFEPATSVTGTRSAKRLIIDALAGAIAGALIGVIAALSIGRRDRRLRQRDEIAASVGIPVLASFPVVHPTNAASWMKLLEDYEPGPLQALRLRQAMQQLGVLGRADSSQVAAFSVAVLSLSSDPGALAIGPQLAVFAASLGIPTALVIGPHQVNTATASLRAACSAESPTSSKRPRHLRVSISDGTGIDEHPDTVLTIVVIVVDGGGGGDGAPEVADTIRTATTVLGVSAGRTTAEQLARVVSSAAADREISGILVADPDPADRSPGLAQRVVQVGITPTAGRPTGHDKGHHKVDDPDQTMTFTAKIGSTPPSTEIRR